MAEPLKEKHELQLTASSLTKKTIEKCGYRSTCDGWQFDITNPFTREVQYSITRKDKVEQGFPKYLQPKDTKPYPYFSKQIDDWESIFSNKNIPVIITEGSKKADCAIQNGFITVSIQGTYGWSHNKKLIDPMKWFLSKGRDIYIAFDSDQLEKESVKDAVVALAKEAHRRGCNVKTINLPRHTKGIDDFFVYYKSEAKEKFQELMDLATNPIEGLFLDHDEIRRRICSTKDEVNLDFTKLPEKLKDFYLWSKDSTHAPDEIIIAGMIGTLSAALGKQVAIVAPGGKNLYPNLWMCGIAPSGRGKTTAMNISLDLLHEINIDQVNILLEETKAYDRIMRIYEESSDETLEEPIRPKVRVPILPTMTSKEKLYEILSYGDASGVIATSEELSILLADINSDRNVGLKPLMISLYGGSKSAPMMSFKNTVDLPPIEEPAVGILGVSTMGSFFQSFSYNDFFSGLLQRFNFVVGKLKPKLAMPPQRDVTKEEEFRQQIISFFNISKNFAGNKKVYSLSLEAKEYWCKTYNSLDERFGYIYDEAVGSSFSRMNDETIFKIALVFHCLEDLTKDQVSKSTLEKAIEFVQFLKQSLLYVLEQKKNQTKRNEANKIVAKLQSQDSYSLTLKKLKDKCGAHRNPSAFDDTLDWLNDLGIVEIKQIPNNSNNDTVSQEVSLMLTI